MPISHGHKPFQYNDFVAPVEADDLIKAVDVKQNLYDQGTAAIDAKMHSLAGFDIAREQDREYANQELKKIYNVIQTNSSKDFSNPQIIKNFLDVAKPLENDARFKNAIDSTKELRARQKTLSEVRNKPGMYSAANEYHYMKDVQAWQNDPNAGATLNHKEYVPYKDISKKVMEIVKQLKPDLTSTMQDVGKWLSTESLKSLEGTKIRNAVMSQLSADEINQMQIDANFNSANQHPQIKFNTVATALTQTIKENEEWARIKGSQNKTGYTQEEHALMAKAAREELKTLNDPASLDALYANSYISNFVDGIGKAYSYREFTQKLQADPFALSQTNHSLDLANFKVEETIRHTNAKELLGIKGQQGIDLALAQGKILEDPDNPGEYIPNPNYKPKKKTKAELEAEAAENYIFSRDKTDAGKAKPNPLNDKLEEEIVSGNLTQPIEKTAGNIDDNFKIELEAALKYIVGEDGFSDYSGQDYKVRFEPLIEGDSRTTKVTIVDNDYGVFGAKDNQSFTIAELFAYADAYRRGDTATDVDINSAK